MEQIHAFEKENTISFSNRKSLIQFVSKYIAFLYKEYCEYWKATTRDDTEERMMWEQRIKEIPALEKAIKDLLNTKRYLRRNLKFTSRSIFFKEVFKEAKIPPCHIGCIPYNVEYEINDLVFKRDVKCRPN